MSKIRYAIFLLFASLFLFTTTNASALAKNFVVKDITVKEKTGTVAVEDPVLSGNAITSNITFNKKDDSVTFELSLENKESEGYRITSVKDDNTNDNIHINYSFSNDYIGANETGVLIIKLTYANALINVDKISLDDLTINISLIGESGESGDIIINPFTADTLPYYCILFAIALVVLILSLKNKTIKGAKIGGVLIALVALSIPFAALAKEEYEVQVKFTDIDIIGEFEIYDISIDLKNGSEVVVVPVRYGDKLENLPANPSKDGYNFDKWVDGDGNEVTTDTVITGPISVEAQYTIKNYSITYDLSDGALLDGKTNPDSYTIEDEFTINNPTKQGYTFAGWSGTGIDDKTTSLVIAKGSKDDRSYTANYSANTNTPYVVKHLKQKLTLDGYETADIQNLTGTTDAPIAPAVNTYPGFKSPEVQHTTIAADESTEVVYYYDREMYSFSFNNNENVTSTKPAGDYPYGTVITLTANTVAGKTFSKWSNNETANPLTVTLVDDLTIEPVYLDSFTKIFEATGECTFNGADGVITGENCDYADGTRKFIDTGIQLYGPENHDKDYEIGFTIARYDSKENVAQATLMNAKMEGNSYPGLVFRKYDNRTDLDLSSRKTSTANSRKYWKADDVVTVKIYRIKNKNTGVQEIFYSINGETKAKINDLSSFNPEFNTTVWFGAAPADAAAETAQRYLVGTLSNMYIKIGTYEEPSPSTYTVRFNPNGGTISPATIVKEKGTAIGELPTPNDIPTDKAFDGWYTELEGGTKIDGSYTPTVDTTVYAHYIGGSLTVSFNTNGGSKVPSQTVDYGHLAMRPTTDPTKEWFLFDDWYTSNEYDTLFDFDNTEITKNTTIYAHFIDLCHDFSAASWSKIKDTLESDPSYYTPGCEKEVEIDTNDDSRPESYTVRLANTSTPEVCATEGYSQTACGFVIEFVDVVERHIMNETRTNVGGWKESALVNYLNGDFYNKLPNDVKDVIIPTYPIVSGSGSDGISDDITADDMTKNRLYLLSTRELGTNSIFDNKNDKLTNTRPLDYYPEDTVPTQFKEKRIKRNLAGDASNWWLRTADSENNLFFMLTQYEGFPINNLYAGESQGLAPAFRIGTMPDFTVSFDTDGGSAVNPQTITYGEKASKPSDDPTKTDLIFDNWYTSKDYDVVFDFADTAITKDTTVYAHFVSLCRTFSTDSWTTIRDNLESDPSYYPVGCEKEVELDMNDDSVPESYTVRLSNTSTPDICYTDGYSKTACGAVIEFVTPLTTHRMNPNDGTFIDGDGNSGGWEYSEMRSYINNDIFNILPDELKNVIVDTSVNSGHGIDNEANFETIDKMYLLTPNELTDKYTNLDISQTRILDYYASNNSSGYPWIRKKASGTAVDWWLRSCPYQFGKRTFNSVYRLGGIRYDSASYEGWVVPAFRISEGAKPFAVASFNTDGGTLIESQTFESSGNAIRPTTDPVKNGFLFDDWYTDNSYATPFDFINTSISNDTTIYAHFVDLNLCKTFSDDSWSAIRDNLTSDPNYYAIGCEKEVELDMNDDSVPESYTVRLSNTSTPEVCSTEGYSKTSCGLVIEFVDIVSARQMNYDTTNARGWSNTALVWWINSTLYDKLPAELQNVIIPTYPIVSGSGKNTTSPDITDTDVNKNKLYLLSTREIGFNLTKDNKRDETTDTRTLDYYKMNNNNHSRIKRDLNRVTQDWWLRSAEDGNTYRFFYGTYDGGANTNPSDNSYGVAPAFRIGAN